MVNSQDLLTLEEQITIKYEAQIQKLKDDMEAKIRLIEEYTKGQVEALQEVIKRKDDDIANLNRAVGALTVEVKSVQKSAEDLKESNDFISYETTQMKGNIKNNHIMLETSQKNLSKIEDKSRDLEDRQRRNNLVFFKVPESDKDEHGNYKREDCEKLIIDELLRCGIISNQEIEDSQYLMDRAHRLGRKDDSKPYPRPIIVRMTMFKDKQHILKNAYKLATSNMNVSEETLQVHSELTKAAKKAKEEVSDGSIISYRVFYRRISLKFQNTNDSTSYKSFSLKNIIDHPNDWYKRYV